MTVTDKRKEAFRRLSEYVQDLRRQVEESIRKSRELAERERTE